MYKFTKEFNVRIALENAVQSECTAALWLNRSGVDADEGLQLLLQLPTPSA